MPAKARTLNSILRNLPSVDELVATTAGSRIAAESGNEHAAELARAAINGLRESLRLGGDQQTKAELLAAADSAVQTSWRSEMLTRSSRVINATGVVIHTNLGRAPLSENARKAIADHAGYGTLEYDLASGKRGKRGRRAEELLAELTGAESVLIVNNCAAAAFFVLTVFASGGEVVVSRGELVEIGGDFRVPDVLTQSGATLREVGTTNRTKLADYENAINEKTRLLLKVHPSNYKIVGFTSTPTVAELAGLAHKRGLLFYEDIGSGALIDLSSVGLGDEPVVGRSIAAGADVVTFSGDKLLGGPQAGIIAGRREVVDELRRHPLFRTLRADKIVYAALEATLESFRRGAAFDEIPVLRMLALTKDQIAERAARFVENLRDRLGSESGLQFELKDAASAIGGGAAPSVELATVVIAITHRGISTTDLERSLRLSAVPVISRIENDRLLVDLRTVAESEETELLDAIAKLA